MRPRRRFATRGNANDEVSGAGCFSRGIRSPTLHGISSLCTYLASRLPVRYGPVPPGPRGDPTGDLCTQRRSLDRFASSPRETPPSECPFRDNGNVGTKATSGVRFAGAAVSSLPGPHRTDGRGVERCTVAQAGGRPRPRSHSPDDNSSDPPVSPPPPHTATTTGGDPGC